MKCEGEGGIVEATPSEREMLGFGVGNSVRMWRVGCVGSGKWYIDGLLGSVEMDREEVLVGRDIARKVDLANIMELRVEEERDLSEKEVPEMFGKQIFNERANR